MRIAFFGRFDPAGAGYNYAQAINAHTPHEAKAYYNDTFYAGPVNDGIVADNADAIRDADVAICQVTDGPRWMTEKEFASLHEAVTIYWIDGGPFRSRRAEMWHLVEDRPRVATNHDVADEYEAAWTPVCVEGCVETTQRVPDGALEFQVAHPCSDPSVKNSEDLKQVVKHLKSKWSLRTFSGLPHAQWIYQMRRVGVVFDHMQGYFGVSSTEATAIGVPVMNGLNARGWEVMRDWGVTDMPPWHIVSTQAQLSMQLNAGFTRWTDDERRGWYEREFSNRIKAERFVAWLEAL